MTATFFQAHLKIPGAQASDAAVGVAAFALQEGYNTGWGGTATVVARPRSGSKAATAEAMFRALMASGVRPGRPVMLQLVIRHRSTKRSRGY